MTAPEVAAARRAAARLGAVPLLVLDVLLDHAGDGGEAWPGLRAICDAVYGHVSGGGRRQVDHWLGVLAGEGLLVDTGRRVGQRGGTVVWRLPCLAPTGPQLGPDSAPTGPQLGPNSAPTRPLAPREQGPERKGMERKGREAPHPDPANCRTHGENIDQQADACYGCKAAKEARTRLADQQRKRDEAERERRRDANVDAWIAGLADGKRIPD